MMYPELCLDCSNLRRTNSFGSSRQESQIITPIIKVLKHFALSFFYKTTCSLIEFVGWKLPYNSKEKVLRIPVILLSKFKLLGLNEIELPIILQPTSIFAIIHFVGNLVDKYNIFYILLFVFVYICFNSYGKSNTCFVII